MKRVVWAILIVIPWFGSCDKIENPIIPKDNIVDTIITTDSGDFIFSDLYPDTGGYLIPDFGEFPSSVKNILIEDFTGHRCGTCPPAAVIAHDLKEAYPGRVFVASVHASPTSQFQYISSPGDGTYPKYSTDFRTPAGNEYSDDIGDFIANPSGLINRMNQDGYWFFHPFWATTIDEIINSNPSLRMNIQVKTNYYTETRGLFIHVLSETIEAMQGNYHLVVYLLADEIQDWQKDYSLNPQDVEFYPHKDVLLYNINGTWGEQLFSESSAAGEEFINHYTYAIPDTIAVGGLEPDDNTGLSLIVYLMNRETFEIEQVIEEHIHITF
jgi:hypothetical protein